MRVIVTTTGVYPGPDFLWPEGFPIPAEGDSVSIPGFPDINSVRVVEWYPVGDPDEDEPEPFVYLVLGPRRPS